MKVIAQVLPEAEAISSQKVLGGVRIIKGEKDDAAAVIWNSQGIFSEVWGTAFNEKKRVFGTHRERVARFVSRSGEYGGGNLRAGRLIHRLYLAALTC